MNIWVAIYRSAWGILFVLVCVVMVGIFVPRCNRLREMQRKKMNQQEENRKTEMRINELKVKQERFQSDPAFVERTARESGMVKTNETVIKVMPPEAKPEQP